MRQSYEQYIILMNALLFVFVLFFLLGLARAHPNLVIIVLVNPSETQADSEVSRAPTISKSFPNVYVDEPHNSPYPLDNVYAPSMSFNLKEMLLLMAVPQC